VASDANWYGEIVVALTNPRRSFLFGRQATPQDGWSKFVLKLRDGCTGQVRLVDESQALLEPAKLDDVLQARKLCQAFGVVMALQGLALPEADRSKFVLWVQAGSRWGTLMPLGDTGLWRVDAGCPLAGMQAAGLIEPNAQNQALNFAQWFALAYRYRHLSDTVLADTLHSVDWLLPDGTIEVFGPFGQSDDQPLRSLASQKLVPQLFERMSQPWLQESLQQQSWPLRFHLDALADQSCVNLAHFFVGHGGSLGWLVAATFRKSTNPVPTNLPALKPLSQAEHLQLDESVKQLVDPEQAFLSPADQNG